jgi:hypothetical protein
VCLVKQGVQILKGTDERMNTCVIGHVVA